MPKYWDCEPVEPPPVENGLASFCAVAAAEDHGCTGCRESSGLAGRLASYVRATTYQAFGAAPRGYAEAININNVRNLDASKAVRILSYAGQVMPTGLEYAYGIFSWWYYQITGRVIVWTTGTPDYWIQAKPHQTSMQGTYRSPKGSAVKTIASHFAWGFDHFIQTPCCHESGHFWQAPGTPVVTAPGNPLLNGHTADRLSIMSYQPAGRRMLTAGPDGNQLRYGLPPREVAGWRARVNGG